MFDAFYLDGIKGRLFCVYHPSQKPESNKAVLLYPPFAEELNKSRKMLALQAKQFSEAGYNVLLVDLYGTGDSEGLLEHADLNLWYQDLTHAIDWLKQVGNTEFVLWGVRLGALILLNHLKQLKNINIKQIVWWQPVLRSEQFLTQFLRLRLAAGMMDDGEKETMAELTQILQNGECLEVAGYTLPPQLFKDMTELAIPAEFNNPVPKINWLETAINQTGKPSPATIKLVEHLTQKDLQVEMIPSPCTPFWNSQEIVVEPDLIAATTGIFSK